jgi:tetratricopeptide (TPR) repeat protein
MPGPATPVHPAVEEANRQAHDLYEQRQYEAACVIVRRAIAVHPTSPSLWTNLGAFLWNLRKHEEALNCHRRALKYDPTYSLAWGNMGLALRGQGRFAEAETAYNTALLHDPKLHSARWDRALLYLSIGEYEKGFVDYEARIDRRPDLHPKLVAPLWQGEDLTDRTIYVPYEQGIGDQIMLSRFLPWLSKKAKKVYVCLPHLVAPLLWGYFGENVEYVPERVPIPKTDYSVWMGSLPRRYGATVKTLPPDPGIVRERCRTYGDRIKIPVPPLSNVRPFKIGICWTGNPAMDDNKDRSIPLELLLELADDPRVWLYSLQAGPGVPDIRRVGAERVLYDASEELSCKGLVAAGTMINQLDLVVTCCTSIAHLAAALGVETWVPLCHLPYWVWGSLAHPEQFRPPFGAASPWWPKVRLFRQDQPGEWRPVIEQVKLALRDALALGVEG